MDIRSQTGMMDMWNQTGMINMRNQTGMMDTRNQTGMMDIRNQTEINPHVFEMFVPQPMGTILWLVLGILSVSKYGILFYDWSVCHTKDT